jgi:hypothetical protein
MNKKYFLISGLVIVFLLAIFFFFNTDKSDGGGIFSKNDNPSAQETTLNTLGYPAHFMIEYLPRETDTGASYIRHEIWYYPDVNKKIVFLAGDIAYVDILDPKQVPSTPTPLQPENFVYGQTIEEVSTLLGEEAREIELIEGLSNDDGIQTVLSLSAVAAFEDGVLTYIQTLNPPEDTTPPEWTTMSDNEYLNLSLLSPNTVYARNIFRDGLRCIGKVCRFVQNVPNKITRPLGPVVGPIVSAILTNNLSKHAEIGKIFRDVNRIDKVIKSIEEQKRLVGELKKVYKDQANQLRKQAEELNAQKDLLGKKLITGEVTFDEYKEAAMDIHIMLNSLEAGAQRLEGASERVNTGTILNMLGKDILKQLANQAGDIVMSEIQGEVKRLLNLDVVKNLIRQGEGGEDAILDLLFSSELRRSLSSGSDGIDIDALKKRIRDQLRQMIKDNQRDLRNNWNTRITDLINETRNQLRSEMTEKEKEELDLSGTICEKSVEPTTDKCGPGYEFKPRSGTGCVQANCNSIPNAHWSYTGTCVCGSAGSINENPNDPNKACYLPADCGPCKSCVYACVHFDEECPDIPSQ